MTDEKRKILFVGEKSVSDAVRCNQPAVELAKMNYAETMYQSVDFRGAPTPPNPDIDAVVFSRPHHDTLLTSYKRMRIPILVDMDDDFHSIPESNPAYKYVGNGNPVALMKMENCIYSADRLIVTTQELEGRLRDFVRRPDKIKVIPNGWSSRDPHWLTKRSTYRDRVIIGWGGTPTHREDFRMCIQPIKKVLKENPSTMICIAGDPEIYNYFRTVKESQKLFIPMVPYRLYPIVLSMWDIMLAPLLDNHFNRGKSDIKLVDAGAKGIPFIASKMAVYNEWPGGGLLVDDDGWYEAISWMVKSKEKRTELGKEGRSMSKKRDMLKLGSLWRDAIEEIIEEREREEMY